MTWGTQPEKKIRNTPSNNPKHAVFIGAFKRDDEMDQSKSEPHVH